jgi:hypothetical protein
MPELDLDAIHERSRLMRSHDGEAWLAEVVVSLDDFEAMFSELRRRSAVPPVEVTVEWPDGAEGMNLYPGDSFGVRSDKRPQTRCKRSDEYLRRHRLGAYSVPSSPDEEV